jgi:hypothetical protein
MENKRRTFLNFSNPLHTGNYLRNLHTSGIIPTLLLEARKHRRLLPVSVGAIIDENNGVFNT